MNSTRQVEIARALFRETNDALFVFDPHDQSIVDTNPAALRLTGFERKAVLAMNIRDLFTAAEPDGLRYLIEAFQKTQFFHSREEYGLSRRSGGPLSVNISVSRIHAKPEPLGLVVARDITERRRAQEVLERFFRLSPALFCILGSDGRVQKVNLAWERTLGYSTDDLRALTPLVLIAPDDLPAAQEVMAALDRGEDRCLESQFRQKGGGYRWLSWSTATASGSTYIVAQDVTERKRSEALKQAKEASDAANRAKGQFLAHMSHELRTPLTAMLGLVDVFLEDPELRDLPPDRIEDFRTIGRNGKHLLSLIDDILDLSKVEAGKLDIELVPCNPARLAEGVVSLLRSTAVEKGIALSLETTSPLPETVRTDAIRLRQALINLVGNAIKFTERGGVHLRVALEPASPTKALLRFDVIDTGVGMTPEEVDSLFQPFHRVGSGAGGGHGLGLVISRRLAELLGGTIEVRSDPGRGSTFRLTIAVEAPEPIVDVPPTRPDPQPLEPSLSPRSRPELAGRILLAEDHPDNSRAIVLRLTLAGLDVTAVGDGQQAYDEALRARARGNSYDVILMDVQMPVLGGIEATRRLRLAGYEGPILALTAYSMAEDRDECLRQGFDEHVSKPVDWNALLDRITTLIGWRPGSAPSPGDS